MSFHVSNAIYSEGENKAFVLLSYCFFSCSLGKECTSFCSDTSSKVSATVLTLHAQMDCARAAISWCNLLTETFVAVHCANGQPKSIRTLQPPGRNRRRVLIYFFLGVLFSLPPLFFIFA